jgi:hypothetical protein
VCVDLWPAAEEYAEKNGGDPDDHYSKLKGALKDLERAILQKYDFPANSQLKAVPGARQVNFAPLDVLLEEDD